MFEFDTEEALGVGPHVPVKVDRPRRKSKRELAETAVFNRDALPAMATGENCGRLPSRGAAPSPAATVPDPASNGQHVAPSGGDFLYIDLETVPDYARLETFGLDPVPEPRKESPIGSCPEPADTLGQPIASVVDELRALWPCDEWLGLLIAAEKSGKARAGVVSAVESFRREKLAAVNAVEERRKLLSVKPEYCRIAATGLAVGGGEVESVVVVDPADEADAIEALWDYINECGPIVGFNVLAFDLPVLLMRSILLGVTIPRMPDLRPWGRDVIDLMKARWAGGEKPMGLKPLARCLGIAVPAGDCDGSQVETLLTSDPAKLAEYVRSDVAVTREVHRLFQGAFCL